MTYTVTVLPASEPVTLDEVKAALRIDGTDFDSDLGMLVQSAREVAEQETGRLLMPQTVRLDLRDWPDAIDIATAPVRSIDSVSYWDGSNWTTIPALSIADYRDGTHHFVEPVTSWPMLGDRKGPRIRVTFEVGYADAAAVPACVKKFIIAQVGAWFRNPEAVTTGKQEVSPFLSGLLDPVRVYA